MNEVAEYEEGYEPEGPTVVEEDPKGPEDVVEPEPAAAVDEAGVEEPNKIPHKNGSRKARERAEREAALRIQAEAKIAELEAKLNAPKVPAGDPDEPKLDSFDDFEEWQNAFREHAEKKAAAKAEDRLKADRAKSELEKKQRAWQEADDRYAETKADWDDVIEDLREVVQGFNPDNAPGFGAMDTALTQSDIAPALKYHLGTNPEEAKRIAALQPYQAIKEMALLEIRLSSGEPTTPKQEKQVSKAPPPIRPVQSSVVNATADTRFGGIEEY